VEGVMSLTSGERQFTGLRPSGWQIKSVHSDRNQVVGCPVPNPKT
jgi:hypothetical protein